MKVNKEDKTYPRDDDKQTGRQIIIGNIFEWMSLQFHLKTCQRKVVDSIPNVKTVSLIHRINVDRIIQNSVRRFCFVKQFLHFEFHFLLIVSKAADSEFAYLSIERIQIKSHWTPESHVSLLRIEDLGCINQPQTLKKLGNFEVCPFILD